MFLVHDVSNNKAGCRQPEGIAHRQPNGLHLCLDLLAGGGPRRPILTNLAVQVPEGQGGVSLDPIVYRVLRRLWHVMEVLHVFRNLLVGHPGVILINSRRDLLGCELPSGGLPLGQEFLAATVALVSLLPAVEAIPV